MRAGRLHPALALLLTAGGCSATVDRLDLPCDPRHPYEAPRDPRLAPLFEDDAAASPPTCSDGAAWLAAYPLADDPGASFSAAHKDSLHWGTYRPHLYFGARTRTFPAAAVTGVAWRRPRNPSNDGGLGLRHDCGSDVYRYGYTSHDGRTYAEQAVHDKGLGVVLGMQLAKPGLLDPTEAFAAGVAWVQTVTAAPVAAAARHANLLKKHGPLQMSFYAGVDCDDETLPLGECLSPLNGARPLGPAVLLVIQDPAALVDTQPPASLLAESLHTPWSVVVVPIHVPVRQDVLSRVGLSAPPQTFELKTLVVYTNASNVHVACATNASSSGVADAAQAPPRPAAAGDAECSVAVVRAEQEQARPFFFVQAALLDGGAAAAAALGAAGGGRGQAQAAGALLRISRAAREAEGKGRARFEAKFRAGFGGGKGGSGGKEGEKDRGKEGPGGREVGKGGSDGKEGEKDGGKEGPGGKDVEKGGSGGNEGEKDGGKEGSGGKGVGKGGSGGKEGEKNGGKDSLGEKEGAAARAAVANVVGGAGFWHGRLLVAGRRAPAETAEKVSLFSFTPSRSFFPRGFLWDEGFHLRVVAKFDKALAAESLTSWLLTARGHTDPTACPGAWIPREQALGHSARSRVPREFLAQSPAVANPPTLLSLAALPVLADDRAAAGPACEGSPLSVGACGDSALFDAKPLRAALLPVFEAWAAWLVRTQAAAPAAYPGGADAASGLYAWKGRDPGDGRLVPMALSSGLDDYPRSYWPSPHEAHVDLASWVAAGYTALAALTFRPSHRQRADAAVRAIETHHYHPGLRVYADRGLTAGLDASLRRDVVVRCKYSAGNAVDAGVPVDEVAGMRQREAWARSPEITPGMRVEVAKGLKLKNGRAVPRGSRGTVARVDPARAKPVELRTDAGPAFWARRADVAPLLSAAQMGDFCPASHPHFLWPLAAPDGQGLMTRMKFVSAGAPEPGLLTEHAGYVSLMPVLLKVIPYEGSEERVDAVIRAMGDERMLGPHGLRSLSTASPLYQTENAPGDAPYWRGAMWINMNYLALDALKHYEDLGSEAAATFRLLLQKRIGRSVVDSYNSTGFFWEQYDDNTGLGARTHPFSGWTTLIANVLTESYT
ncbi:Mannosyl-oligosaccharide glucosidase [Diplonema papillatum]|nr:Mannosyl-oligosaccharide glucosidase [Diplonema papillatum]